MTTACIRGVGGGVGFLSRSGSGGRGSEPLSRDGHVFLLVLFLLLDAVSGHVQTMVGVARAGANHYDVKMVLPCPAIRKKQFVKIFCRRRQIC